MDNLATSPAGKLPPQLPPWDPEAEISEGETPGVWDWMPRDELAARAPKDGPDGASDNDNLLNIVLAIITGLAVVAVTNAVVRSITR